jgi:gliding motility-associated-like protein
MQPFIKNKCLCIVVSLRNMKKIFLLSFLIGFSSLILNAQRGKDGVKTITTTEVVNAYTTLTNNAGVGNTAILVTNNALNNNFTSNLASGDLVMIIQVQGATISNPLFSPTWGDITNYNNCGNYELLQVEGIQNNNVILFDCSLQNQYDASGNVIVIRVPRYSSLTINGGGTLTADPWNGATGGVLAVEVNGTTTINAGGSIDVSDLGFRGGQFEMSTLFGGGQYTSNNPQEGAEKGESIAGDQVFYSTSLNGRYARAAAANGGGGGDAHNAGGAGGANAGDIANWNTGTGVPDPTYNIAWAIETPSISGVVSSGGGRGGYSHTGGDGDELTQAPGTWTGDGRRQVGGLGGRPLDYSTGKIFLGGAGGAGDGEDNTDGATPGNGGNGGGIAFISTYGNINGAGNINSNGQNGLNCQSPAPGFSVSGKDAAGGAGAGGTILLQTTGTVSGVTINVNGGTGGNQVFGGVQIPGEAEGPGGGGGGGYIAITSGTPTRNANGGTSGTTNSPYMNNSPTFPNNFAPNGATGGGIGLPNESIDAFDITVNNANICANNTATLTATITGIAPAGVIVEWFDSPIAGTLLFTGNPFTTPSLAVTTTYYVKVCPAPFRVPVTVTVGAAATPSFNPVSAICSGDPLSPLPTTSTNGVTGTWSPALDNTTTTLYTFTPTAGQCATSATLTITVNSATPATFNPVAPICSGDPLSPLPTTSTNGFNGSWSPALDNTTTTLYTFTPTAGQCATSATLTITVNSATAATFNPVAPICIGDPLSPLPTTSTNGFNGSWSPALDNTTTTLYTFTPTAGQCTTGATLTITVNNCGVPPVTSFSATDSSICIGDCIDFNDLSSGGPTGWTWYFFGSTTANSSNQNPTNICYNSIGSFDVALVSTNAAGQDSLFIAGFITVNALPIVTANATNTSICSGDLITLTGNGANTYTWDNGAVDGVAFSPAGTITYIVTGTDANGCTDTASVTITVNSCSVPPVANLSASNTSICISECIDFNDLSSGGTTTAWSWYFSGGNPSTSILQNPMNICYDSTGIFDVALMVSNAFGQDSIFISNYILVDSCNTTPTSVIIPNVFSPNGDGQNDLFGISGSGIVSVKADIYNRWGSLIFSAQQLNEGWDGRTTAGTECSEGTYFYILVVETNDESVIHKGTLTLIR